MLRDLSRVLATLSKRSGLELVPTLRTYVPQQQLAVERCKHTETAVSMPAVWAWCLPPRRASLSPMITQLHVDVRLHPLAGAARADLEGDRADGRSQRKADVQTL